MAPTDRLDKGVTEQPFWTRAQQLEKQAPCQVECPNSGNVRGWLGIIAQRRKHGFELTIEGVEKWIGLAFRRPAGIHGDSGADLDDGARVKPRR